MFFYNGYNIFEILILLLYNYDEKCYHADNGDTEM